MVSPERTGVAGRRTLSRARDAATPLFKDPFRLAMLALIVQTISKFSSFIGPLQVLRPALALFACCVLFALSNPKKVFSNNVLRFPAPRLILVQAALALASCVFGISLGHAATFVINVYWKVIVFALLLMTSLHTLADVRRTVWATSAGGMILAFIAVFVVHISKDNGAEQYDANDLGLVMVVTVPLVLLLFQTSNKVGRIICAVGLALIAASIVKTSSRGAFIGGSVVGIALLIFLPGISVVKRVSAVVGMVATMAVFAPPGYWDSMSNLISNPKADYNWDSETGRRKVAKRGISYMLQYPVFGVGINNFSMAEVTISEYWIARKGDGVKMSAPHNSWVEAGAETGIPGLLVWAALIVGSAWSLVRLRRRMPKEWAKTGTPDQRFLYLSTLYVPIAFVGFAVCGTFVSFAWSDPSYILPAIAMGIQKVMQERIPMAAASTANGRATVRGRRMPRPATA